MQRGSRPTSPPVPGAPRVATGPGAAAGVPKPRALHGAGRGGCHPGDTLNLRLPPLKARRRARAALFVRCRAAPRAGPCHATGPPGVAAAEVAVAGGDRSDTRAEWGRGRPKAQRQDTGGYGAARGRARAGGRAGSPGRAATQKCRRAKRLTPAWPPPPSPSAPPSFPGLRVLRRRRRRRRRQRRGRRFFFKAAPPNPGLGPSPGRAREGPRCTAPRPSRAARRGICNGRAGPAARYSPLSLLSRPPSPGPPLTGSLCALRLLPKTGRGAPTMHRARRAPLSVA